MVNVDCWLSSKNSVWRKSWIIRTMICLPCNLLHSNPHEKQHPLLLLTKTHLLLARTRTLTQSLSHSNPPTLFSFFFFFSCLFSLSFYVPTAILCAPLLSELRWAINPLYQTTKPIKVLRFLTDQRRIGRCWIVKCLVTSPLKGYSLGKRSLSQKVIQ